MFRFNLVTVLLAALPASFAGTLPCADCPGIAYRLDLLPDSAYYLRQTYLERDLAVDTIGSYAFDAGSFVECESGRRFVVEGFTGVWPSETCGALAANLRACIEGGEYEAHLMAALANTVRFERTRHHLELFDSEGRRLARFEAREL